MSVLVLIRAVVTKIKSQPFNSLKGGKGVKKRNQRLDSNVIEFGNNRFVVRHHNR